MSAPVLIGDEVTATAYRLAGARACTPRPDEVDALLATLGPETDLVLITAQYAGCFPADTLARARAGDHPLVLVIPGVFDATPVPDIARTIRRQLGLDA